jgi:hypothetical protein
LSERLRKCVSLPRRRFAADGPAGGFDDVLPAEWRVEGSGTATDCNRCGGVRIVATSSGGGLRSLSEDVKAASGGAGWYNRRGRSPSEAFERFCAKSPRSMRIDFQ